MGLWGKSRTAESRPKFLPVDSNAAFAQGYKAKGKKNKKESVLDRIDNKLKEIKNG